MSPLTPLICTDWRAVLGVYIIICLLKSGLNGPYIDTILTYIYRMYDVHEVCPTTCLFIRLSDFKAVMGAYIIFYVLKLLSKGPNAHLRLTNRSSVYRVHKFWANIHHLSRQTQGLCWARILFFVYWNYGWMDLMLIQYWHRQTQGLCWARIFFSVYWNYG